MKRRGRTRLTRRPASCRGRNGRRRFSHQRRRRYARRRLCLLSDMSTWRYVVSPLNSFHSFLFASEANIRSCGTYYTVVRGWTRWRAPARYVSCCGVRVRVRLSVGREKTEVRSTVTKGHHQSSQLTCCTLIIMHVLALYHSQLWPCKRLNAACMCKYTTMQYCSTITITPPPLASVQMTPDSPLPSRPLRPLQPWRTPRPTSSPRSCRAVHVEHVRDPVIF